MYKPRLSPRETEVLGQIVDGKQVKVIAHELSISSETVRHYIKRIYKELDVHNRADVVRVALETPGLLNSRSATHESLGSRGLIGRDNDLQKIRKLLDQSRLVCIVGMGGIGKTSVARMLADDTGHADRQARLLDLRNTATSDDLFFQIGQAFDHKQQTSTGDVKAAVLRQISNESGTLILDNFEQLSSEAAVPDDIIKASPNLSIVVTSRVELDGSSAVHYPLGGLNIDAASTNGLSSASTLFQMASKQVAPDIVFDDQTTLIADQICQRLGGSPLAIKLASSWLDTLTIDQMRDALEAGSDILTSPWADRSDHRNMLNVIQATLDLRTPAERTVLEKLSVFAGPFDAAAAFAVTGCSAVTMATLLRAALVQTEPGPANSFSLHPLLKDTLRAASQAARDHKDTLDRFCEYYLSPRPNEANTAVPPLNTFPCRGRNHLHAWDICVHHQNFDTLVACAPALAEQMLLAGRGAEALAKLDAGVNAVLSSGHPDYAQYELDLRLALVPIHMTARGHSATETGQNAQRAVALARSQPDQRKLFRALWSAARFEMVRQEKGQRILSLAQECHSVEHEAGRDDEQVLSENLLGGAFFFVGRFATAERHFSACAAIYDPDRHRPLRNVLGQDIGALNYIQQSWTLFYLGRDADALRAARQAEALTFRLGDEASHGWYLVNAACLHFLRGDFQRVHDLASEGLSFAKAAKIEQMISGLCLLNGGARIMLGDADGGLAEVDEGMDLRRKHGLGPVTSWVADLLCTCHLQIGNLDAAERYLRFGIDHADASGCGPSHSELERHLGQILQDRGDFKQAAAAYSRALEIADGQGAKSLSLRAIRNLLDLNIRTGESHADLASLAGRLTGDLQSVDTKEAAAARDLATSFM